MKEIKEIAEEKEKKEKKQSDQLSSSDCGNHKPDKMCVNTL